MESKRRAGMLAIVACSVLTGSPPAFAQAQAPAETVVTLPALTVRHNASATAVADAPVATWHDAANERSRGCWIGADFLLWAARGDHLPPLISASPPGTPRDQAGVLGTPGTTILFGDERVNEDLRPGVRARLGCWLDDCATCGIEASLFYLDPDGAGLTATGPGIVGRPFINAITGQPDAQLVNFPGVVAGSVSASADSTVWGGDITAVHQLGCGDCRRIYLLAGYKFLRLTDTLTINEDLVATEPTGVVEPGTRFQIQDRFRTSNTFHGGAIGLRGEIERGRAVLRCNASVALGNVHQVIDIGGSTSITPPQEATSVLPGGFLALPSNGGRFERDHFAVMPTVGVSLGYQVTCRLQVFAGYDFLYLSRVTRPGDVIDTTINPALLPPPVAGGPARPALLGGGNDYWLHGLTFGMEWRF